MAKKGDILFWLAMGGMYIFAFSLSPFLQYTGGLKYARPGTEPDPAKVSLAQTVEIVYFAIAAVYFTFVIIFWTLSYFSTWKLANRYPRLNVNVVFEPRYARPHLGMGMIAVKEIKGSSIEVENALRSVGLRATFEQIKKEVEQKFHGKTAIEVLDVSKTTKKADESRKKIRFTIDDLKKEDLNFDSFPIEILHKRDWSNFFEEKEIEFFKKQNIKDTNEYLAKSYADLDFLKSKYYNEFKKHRDLGEDQLKLKKCLEFLNKDQVGFLKTTGIHNIQDLLNADLEKLNANYSNQFIKPKTKFLEKFIDAWKLLSGNSDILKQIDFRAMIKYMIEELIAQEKNFAVEIDNVEYMKYIQIRATKIRSMFPDKHAYLVDFDSGFQIPTVMPEFDFYKQREMDINRMSQEDLDIDFSKSQFVNINRVLLLTPVALNDCFNYKAGSIDNFNGHTVDCNQITETTCRFRGMLTADICILEVRSCDWSINFSAVDTIEWSSEEAFNIDMASMLQLVRDEHLITEDIKKSLATEIARVERKEKEIEKMWAKKWADTTPEVAVKRLIKVEAKPINAFVAVIIVVLFVIGTILGLVLGVFLYPWIGDFFQVATKPVVTAIGISALGALISI